MMRSLRVLLLALTCSAALTAQAQTDAPARIDIPPGDLVAALDSLARQSGAQFVYRADQLKGLRTQGVQGARSSDEALDRLLRGSGYAARRDASGAVVIVKSEAAPTPRPAPVTPAASGAAAAQQTTTLETVQVTGSRIPRAQTEGPAPVSIMTAQEIHDSGFASIPDVLRAMTPNG